MYNPYQRMAFLTIKKDQADLSTAPGLYGRPPDFGSYPGAPPGMGKFVVFASSVHC